MYGQTLFVPCVPSVPLVPFVPSVPSLVFSFPFRFRFFLGVLFLFSFRFVFVFVFCSSLFIPNILRDAEGTLLSHPRLEGPPSISLR
jgi:hypothetical protein